MANYKEIIPFILQAEGGLSKAKTDKASLDLVPDGKGFHTNKGITWTTLKKYQSRLGVSQDMLIQIFYMMPQHVWEMVFKLGYWDAMKGDQIKSQAIADTLVDWAWTSGPVTAIRKLQQFMRVPVNSRMDARTLQRLNAISDEGSFLKSFSDFKKQWYLTLPNQSANYEGWAKRLDRLYESVKTKVVENKGSIALVATGVVATGVLLYMVFRNKNSKMKQAA
jgi:lysozyme family protein